MLAAAQARQIAVAAPESPQNSPPDGELEAVGGPEGDSEEPADKGKGNESKATPQQPGIYCESHPPSLIFAHAKPHWQ